MREKKTPFEPMICDQCGKKFIGRIYKRRKFVHRFCSRDCKKNFGKITKICVICKIPFTLAASIPNRKGHGSCCSMKCKKVLYSIKRTGENSPNWKGGIARLPYPYEWNKKLKHEIIERDNHQCQECGNNKNLCVHHIDYNKDNCSPSNLITLCYPCHSKTNYNREFWTTKYQTVLQAYWI